MPLCEMEDAKGNLKKAMIQISELSLHKEMKGRRIYNGKIIMHGCNGHMGQVISDLVEKDPDAEIVAGIDVADQGKNSYPVLQILTNVR